MTDGPKYKPPTVMPHGDNACVRSVAPTGKCCIINMYWDPIEQKAIFEYEDTPEP